MKSFFLCWRSEAAVAALFLTRPLCSCLKAMAMVPQRDKALQEELNKQNSNDTLRATFATQANTVGAYIQAKMEVTDQLFEALQLLMRF